MLAPAERDLLLDLLGRVIEPTPAWRDRGRDAASVAQTERPGEERPAGNTKSTRKETAMQTIQIQATPTPVQIDPDRTAVIVIDMQNAFGSPGGMFDKAGIDIVGIQAAVAPTERQSRRPDEPGSKSST